MGQPRKIESVELMEQLWEEYKNWCDNQMVMTHDFSAKNSEFVSAELKRSITYTLEGFCVYIGLARKAFYDTYAADPDYTHTVTRMREEAELDARRKFEVGAIPTQLAGLWMSKHGYTTKSEENHRFNGEPEEDKLSASLRKLADEIDRTDEEGAE